MPVSVNQRNVTRNQSTADFDQSRLFIFDNRFVEAQIRNKGNDDITVVTGNLVVRDNGTYEVATVVFPAAGLTAAQTVILAGLTYTSTAVTTQAQLAEAFANLADGATTGAGTATGTYSGTFANFTTGPVISNTTVVFTNVATGNTTNLVQTGTGPASAITIVPGTSSNATGVLPATSGNIADVVGVAAVFGSVVLGADEVAPINYGTKGTIDGNLLVLPAGVTLSTIVGAKTLRDVLESLGLHVDTSTIDNTLYDN